MFLVGNVCRCHRTVGLGGIRKEAMRLSILDSVPPKTLELNEKAFEAGYQRGLQALQSREEQEPQ